VAIVALILLAAMYALDKKPSDSPGDATNSNTAAPQAVALDIPASDPSAGTSAATASESKPQAPEPPRPKWQYQSEKDEMRGVTNRWASLTSEDAVSLEFPYGGGSTLRIVVRSMPKRSAQDIILNLSKGQLDCGFDGCRVPVKFDDNAIINYSANRARGGDNDSIFIQEKSGFLKRLKASKSVMVEVPIWKHGPTQFRFSSAGLEWK